MTENKMYSVDELFGSHIAKTIYKEISDSRRCEGDDKFSYKTIERKHEDRTYVITPRHVPLKESMSFGKSKCKQCYGTGKFILNMDKSRISNVEDFQMISETSFDGLTEDQKKIVIEKEKQKKFWKILLPCSCTILNMIKKGKQIISNDLNNIVIEITCTEKVSE